MPLSAVMANCMIITKEDRFLAGGEAATISQESKMWRKQKEIEWYLPIAVAADQLGCHSRKVFELAETGIVRFIRMPGNELKISAESIHGVTIQGD